MHRITPNTYVFLGLNTNDFRSGSNARITELSLLALSRRDLENPLRSTDVDGLPRVRSNFTKCVHPDLPISKDDVAKSAGLDMKHIMYQNKFSTKLGDHICSFLELQDKPVVLIANNGSTFQFPILRLHLRKVKMDLPDDTLLCDSLKVFKDSKCLNVDNRATPDHLIATPSTSTAPINKPATLSLPRRNLWPSIPNNSKFHHSAKQKAAMPTKTKCGDQWAESDDDIPDDVLSQLPMPCEISASPNSKSYKLADLHSAVYGDEYHLGTAEGDACALARLFRSNQEYVSLVVKHSYPFDEEVPKQAREARPRRRAPVASSPRQRKILTPKKRADRMKAADGLRQTKLSEAFMVTK